MELMKCSRCYCMNNKFYCYHSNIVGQRISAWKPVINQQLFRHLLLERRKKKNSWSSEEHLSLFTGCFKTHQADKQIWIFGNPVLLSSTVGHHFLECLWTLMKIHGAKVVPLTHISEVDKTDTMFGSRINSSVNASLPKITHSYRVTLNENKIFSKMYIMACGVELFFYHPW